MEKLEMTEELDMGGMYEELVEEILNHIPIKPLIRMKCLSKGWCSFISRYRLSRPRSSSMKFVCQYRISGIPESQVIFLDAKEQGGEIESFEHESLSFSLNRKMEFYGASNGLLLLRDHKNMYSDETFYYVCNPTLNQWVALPQVCVLGNKNHADGAGLAFDGLPQNHYKVVCFALDREEISASGHLECVIYSSDVCAWREHKSVFLNSSLVEHTKNISGHTPYLYRKGSIHWLLDVYMLVYHIRKDFFELIKVPIQNNDDDDRFPRMWESEGSLHISYSNEDKLHICAFVPDNIDHEGIAYMEADEFPHGQWQLKHILDLAKLRTRHPEILNTIPENMKMCFEPCGFNEDSQFIYIRLPGMIVSYSLETKTLKMAWAFQKSGNDLSEATQTYHDIDFRRSFCMRLTGVSLPLGGNSELLHPKKVSQGSVGRPLLLF